MRATRFEFEKRFWIICAIYLTGFCLSAFDHVPFIVALRHLIAPSIAGGGPQAIMFTHIAITTGALLVFLAAGLRTWAAAYLRTAVVHDTAQHSEALVADGPFRYTRNPLYLASLTMAAGIGVLASRSGFFFPVVGELDSCLSANFSGRRIPAENPRGIISRVLPSGPAFLAGSKAASSIRESPARLGSGLRGRELCLDIWAGRITSRDHAAAIGSTDCIFTGISGAFSNHPTDPKATKRVTGDAS